MEVDKSTYYEEIIVEGLDYEDFIALKQILTKCTTFSSQEEQELLDNTIIIEKIDKILEVFDE